MGSVESYNSHNARQCNIYKTKEAGSIAPCITAYIVMLKLVCGVYDERIHIYNIYIYIYIYIYI